jgi:MYXO-CTERM domain-containing protein
MKTKMLAQSVLLGAACAAGVISIPASAHACGGLFCSSPNLPINQAAEKIIFSANADNTVTAVIQIAYQGPAPKFSWLLPISSVPNPDQIGVASNLAFQRLQSATNPQYGLTVSVEGTCADESRGSVSGTGTGGSGGSGGFGGNALPPSADPAVTVDATGTIGAFDYAVISVDPSTADPADAASKWLTTNEYSVSEGAPGLIRPYLQAGMHLLALKLVKGADTGSIRPLMLTYDGKSPMIPIKLTAVAANENMGVMAWVLGTARGVPQNYVALELNEARINWFNAQSNYNAVVTAAADEGTGQGFVTEFAGKTTTLNSVVWNPNDELQWQNARNSVYQSFEQMFSAVYNQWGQWDGFWDAMQLAVTLPANVKFADFRSCPNCYQGRIQFAPSVLWDTMEKVVIKPVRDVQALLDRNPYVTRLYTTMSAKEMTADPLFTFNGELQDVSNVHTANRVIECNSSVSQFNAPWRIELPHGGVVRGVGSAVGIWPSAFDSQPSNQRILRLAASGPGEVIEDKSADIQIALQTYNATQPAPIGGGTSGDGGVAPASPESGGCSTTGGSPRSAGWLWAGAAAALWASRRRQRAAR